MKDEARKAEGVGTGALNELLARDVLLEAVKLYMTFSEPSYSTPNRQKWKLTFFFEREDERPPICLRIEQQRPKL